MRKMYSQLFSALMISIQVAIGLSVPPQHNNRKPNNPVFCRTNNCKKISAYILNGLNPEKDPCDDFYEFACGRWRKTNPLPQGQEEWSRFNVLDKQVERRLIEILEAPNGKDVQRPVALMRKYYRDCMDLATLNRIGIGPIDRILKYLHDWPLLNNNTAATISWQELDRHYSELMGTYSFFYISGDIMIANSSTYEIGIESADFPNTYDFPLDNRWKNHLITGQAETPYVKYLIGVAKNFYRYRNIPYSEGKLMKDVHDILNFEYSLYQATRFAKYRRESIKGLQISYNSFLRTDHNKEANINWLKSIADLLKFVNIRINENQIIHVMEWEYMLKLGRLLDLTPNRVIGK